jgi:Crinkler effector protein N-terminal domain
VQTALGPQVAYLSTRQVSYSYHPLLGSRTTIFTNDRRTRAQLCGPRSRFITHPPHQDTGRPDLKEVVKDKKKQTFRDVDANDLQLFKISIPIDNELDEILAHFQPLHDPDNNVHKLSPVRRLSQAFLDPLVDGYLHIIVQPLPPG